MAVGRVHGKERAPLRYGPNVVGGVTAPDVQNYMRDTHCFTSLGGYRTDSVELSGVGEPATIYLGRLTRWGLSGAGGCSANGTGLYPEGG